MPVLFAQRLRRSNEVVGFAAPTGLGGRWGELALSELFLQAVVEVGQGGDDTKDAEGGH